MGSAGTGNRRAFGKRGKAGISAEGVPFGIDWQKNHVEVVDVKGKAEPLERVIRLLETRASGPLSHRLDSRRSAFAAKQSDSIISLARRWFFERQCFGRGLRKEHSR